MHSAGSLTEMIPVVSYRYSSFTTLILFEVLFNLAIIFTLANMFLGIVLDAFGELRARTELNDYDTKNLCFICDMPKDYFIEKGYDFSVHKTEVHSIWHYINFITYLHLIDCNDMNHFESEIWNSLMRNDISWMPIGDNNI
jgi:hypothetical protein